MADIGFPAHAGMDPSFLMASGTLPWIPRTRGDGPRISGLCAGAPTDSPHTRGWTRLYRRVKLGWLGFPAHAGMDPRSLTSTSTL